MNGDEVGGDGESSSGGDESRMEKTRLMGDVGQGDERDVSHLGRSRLEGTLETADGTGSIADYSPVEGREDTEEPVHIGAV